MTTINKIKNLRPTESDASFKYVCPNCSGEYWVTLRQVKCEQFVIVCDCDTVLKPKPVEQIKIRYKKKKEKPKSETKISEDLIDSEILDRCCKSLMSYGFDKEEAAKLIQKAYKDTKNTDCATLVKMSLSNFGENNGKCN
jgi:hypothetical protein